MWRTSAVLVRVLGRAMRAARAIWTGISVIAVFGRWRSFERSITALWLCSAWSHQCSTTNSGMHDGDDVVGALGVEFVDDLASPDR